MNLQTLTEAEQRLISSILAGDPADALGATADGLKAEHFSSPEGRALWVAICECALIDKAVDPGSVALRLKLDRIGCAHLAAVSGIEPMSTRRRPYTAAVIGDSKRRRVSLALSAAQEVVATAREWPDVLEGIDPHLRAIQNAANDTKSHGIADFIAGAKIALERNERSGSIASPFPGWDRVAGRMAGGDMTVLAARPGCGKTALGLMFADSVAQSGQGVLFASLEMPGDQLVTRLAMQRAGLAGEISSGITPDALRVAKEVRCRALDEIASLDGRLVIGEPMDCGTLAQIEARATLLAQAKCGLGLVVIDYLQLLAVPAELRRDTRERQVAEMSRRVKLMALALGVPVMLLAQLNRESEKEDRRPRLSDLRESGSIEQDADRVWFLFTPRDAISAADAFDVPVVLFQAKARHGAPGIEGDLRFRRPQVRFFTA